jgi:hypothetical protein
MMVQLSVEIPFFAIGRQPLGDTRDFYYPLYYPQNQQTFSSSIGISEVINFGIFFNRRQNLFGLKVRDFQCWRKLTSYYSSLTDVKLLKVDFTVKSILGILKSGTKQ